MRVRTKKYFRDYRSGHKNEQVFDLFKDVNPHLKGHVKAELFRGEADENNKLVEAETDNVIMNWVTNALKYLPLMFFNMLAGSDGFTGTSGVFGVTTYYADPQLTNANLLYTPPEWATRLKLFNLTNPSDPYRYMFLSNLSSPENADERVIPSGTNIIASVDLNVRNQNPQLAPLRISGTTYSCVLDKKTIRWVYDFSGASGAGTVNSVHLAEGLTVGTSRQFARALLPSPIVKTTDDVFRVTWTFTRDLLPGEPA